MLAQRPSQQRCLETTLLSCMPHATNLPNKQLLKMQLQREQILCCELSANLPYVSENLTRSRLYGTPAIDDNPYVDGKLGACVYSSFWTDN